MREELVQRNYKANQLKIQSVINSISNASHTCIRKNGQHFEMEMNVGKYRRISCFEFSL